MATLSTVCDHGGVQRLVCIERRLGQLAKYIAVLPLFLPGEWLPRILKASLAFSVTGVALVFCLILTLRKQNQPFTFITAPYAGTSGWNTGVSWIMGVGNSMLELDHMLFIPPYADESSRYAFGSTDAVIHIAEEMKHPESDIPRTMYGFTPFAYCPANY